jgi:hypothetical protein
MVLAHGGESCIAYIPGHFFNIEHSPYLFPMFSFKKHMYACMESRNQGNENSYLTVYQNGQVI